MSSRIGAGAAENINGTSGNRNGGPRVSGFFRSIMNAPRRLLERVHRILWHRNEDRVVGQGVDNLGHQNEDDHGWNINTDSSDTDNPMNDSFSDTSEEEERQEEDVQNNEDGDSGFLGNSDIEHSDTESADGQPEEQPSNDLNENVKTDADQTGQAKGETAQASSSNGSL